MAMTKAEQARMENLEKALKYARALRWPDYAQPSPMTIVEIDANKTSGGVKWRGEHEKVAMGWLANSYDRGRVERGCSNGTNHGSGNTTSTQGCGRLFRSEADAWRFIRLEMTERFSEILASVDERIERAEVSDHQNAGVPGETGQPKAGSPLPAPKAANGEG